MSSLTAGIVRPFVPQGQPAAAWNLAARRAPGQPASFKIIAVGADAVAALSDYFTTGGT